MGRLLPAKGRRREDYLRVIYKVKKSKGYVRIKDIAEELGVSPPSVIDFLDKLTKDGLVIYEKGGKVDLTSKGAELGKEYFERHESIKKFLMILLNIDEEEAERETCYIEHGLSERSLERMVKFVEFISKCFKELPEFLKNLHRYYETGELPDKCVK